MATTTHTNASSLSATLADSVTRTTLDDVPPGVLTVARAHILDAIGIAIASTGMDYGHAVHDAGRRLGSGTDSRVLGFGTPLPAASAALVDGTLIHGLDFDDTHIGAIYHATAPALAAAVAVGEAEGADGATVLGAYVLGVEIGCRLAAAGAGKFHARGFHPTGIAGTFAAACVTAKIRALPAATLTSALGLCGSQAAGILELHGSWLKRMHPGWAAHSGIVAATLAEAGFCGPDAVLEGPAGLYASHIGERPTATSLGIGDLGTRWMTAEVALKPYPCCHFTHAFADAAFSILNELGTDNLHADQVESIICPTAPALLPMVAEPATRKIAPRTIYDALFSIQYVVASAFTGRGVGLDTFYDQPLDHPDTLAIAAKITCQADPATDFPTHFPGEVILRLTDGRILRRKIPASHGTPEDPMTDSEILAKFTTNANRRIPADQAEHVANLVARFDSLPSITDLVDACIVRAGTADPATPTET